MNFWFCTRRERNIHWLGSTFINWVTRVFVYKELKHKSHICSKKYSVSIFGKWFHLYIYRIIDRYRVYVTELIYAFLYQSVSCCSYKIAQSLKKLIKPVSVFILFLERLCSLAISFVFCCALNLGRDGDLRYCGCRFW